MKRHLSCDIEEETYRKILNRKAEMEKAKGQTSSLGAALDDLLEKKK